MNYREFMFLLSGSNLMGGAWAITTSRVAGVCIVFVGFVGLVQALAADR